jgi:ketosteroid isomerase-like protein
VKLERCDHLVLTVRSINLHEVGREGSPGGGRPHFVEDIDRVTEQQWRRVWPNIRDFTIRTDAVRGEISGDRAWAAAPWDSLDVRPDGTTFSRPGRLTIALETRDGRWLARHTHCSLSPAPA